MSKALAVYHGRFGRASIYQLNRPFNLHAHREGHLIFHVAGTPASLHVSGKRHLLTQDAIVAINPWEPHNFVPRDLGAGALFFVLYVNPAWFACAGAPGEARLSFGQTAIARTPALDALIRRAAAQVGGGDALDTLDRELRMLIDACHEATWRQGAPCADRPASGQRIDFRVRKSMRLMSESLGAELDLDGIAKESGLSRPHFYKLFRVQTGVTPHIYVNTLRMEKAIDAVVGSERPFGEIGFELGFSSQSGFTRFFAANVGMAPTDYRYAARVL